MPFNLAEPKTCGDPLHNNIPVSAADDRGFFSSSGSWLGGKKTAKETGRNGMLMFREHAVDDANAKVMKQAKKQCNNTKFLNRKNG